VNQEPELTRSHPNSAMFLALPFQPRRNFGYAAVTTSLLLRKGS
jgi:hypothetical protein